MKNGTNTVTVGSIWRRSGISALEMRTVTAVEDGTVTYHVVGDSKFCFRASIEEFLAYHTEIRAAR